MDGEFKFETNDVSMNSFDKSFENSKKEYVQWLNHRCSFTCIKELKLYDSSSLCKFNKYVDAKRTEPTTPVSLRHRLSPLGYPIHTGRLFEKIYKKKC